MSGTCRTCRYWQHDEYDYGDCEALLMSDKVDIQCEGGHNGCMITTIITEGDFCCSYYKEREES